MDALKLKKKNQRGKIRGGGVKMDNSDKNTGKSNNMTAVTGKSRLKVAFILDRKNFTRAFHADDLAFLETFTEITGIDPGAEKMSGNLPGISLKMLPDILPAKIDESYIREALQEAEACITCWGTHPLTESALEKASSLRLLAHAAGTPKAVVTDAVWKRGIRVFTAAPIIAIDVAETTLGAIIASIKKLHVFDKLTREGKWAECKNVHMGKMKRLNSRLVVGVVSASQVGRNLIRMLKPFGVQILLYDPLISDYAAAELGVRKVKLAELMSESDVVSVHSPNIPATQNMINGEMLALMQDGALLVNTARAHVINEEDLLRELGSGRINAYLDVFHKEPLPADSPLFSMENVLLSPHISGGQTINGGYERGQYLIQQLYSYWTTGILRDETVRDMLNTMA